MHQVASGNKCDSNWLKPKRECTSPHNQEAQTQAADRTWSRCASDGKEPWFLCAPWLSCFLGWLHFQAAYSDPNNPRPRNSGPSQSGELLLCKTQMYSDDLHHIDHIPTHDQSLWLAYLVHDWLGSRDMVTVSTELRAPPEVREDGSSREAG